MNLTDDKLIENMRGRIAQCRRLAAGVLDERTKRALLGLAAEIEADMTRLERERVERTERPVPPQPTGQ